MLCHLVSTDWLRIGSHLLTWEEVENSPPVILHDISVDHDFHFYLRAKLLILQVSTVENQLLLYY
jgi:hypothetical protein